MLFMYRAPKQRHGKYEPFEVHRRLKTNDLRALETKIYFDMHADFWRTLMTEDVLAF